MDEELRAELVERADRDQVARKSLRPGHTMADWETLVAPVDRGNTARLREIIMANPAPPVSAVNAGSARSKLASAARTGK